MPIKEENLTVNEIRYKIITHPDRTNYTYIILGRSLATGKSWLTAALKEAGLNAIEISEYVAAHITYDDYSNHVIEDIANNIITIILNRPLED
jgi:hypothetical protein